MRDWKVGDRAYYLLNQADHYSVEGPVTVLAITDKGATLSDNEHGSMPLRYLYEDLAAAVAAAKLVKLRRPA